MFLMHFVKQLRKRIVRIPIISGVRYSNFKFKIGSLGRGGALGINQFLAEGFMAPHRTIDLENALRIGGAHTHISGGIDLPGDGVVHGEHTVMQKGKQIEGIVAHFGTPHQIRSGALMQLKSDIGINVFVVSG